jgi:hypothetical protein
VSGGLGWILALLTLGWMLWLVAVVFLVSCAALQSNPGLSGPGDPCRDLERGVIGGFFFLFVASMLWLARWSDNRTRR